MTVTAAFAYLISAVLFILALRGLSHPESARKGNMFGMIGMALAIATTIYLPSVESYGLIVLAILIGGVIGTGIALKIEMTALPQLVAGFHSLVGLAAVFVAAAAFYQPEAYGIGETGNIAMGSIIEMSIGVAIGAITFTGSLIAFGKLQGVLSGKPFVFKGQHIVNLAVFAVIVGLIIQLIGVQTTETFWLIVILSLMFGFMIILPIGGADMPVVVSMLNSYSGWAAAGIKSYQVEFYDLLLLKMRLH